MNIEFKKSNFIIVRGDLEKILTFTISNFTLEQYWSAHKMEMENIQTGKSTTLSWNEYKFRNGIQNVILPLRHLSVLRDNTNL